MRCFGLILVLVAASCVCLGCSRPKTPTVTVIGTTGDEDVPSLAFTNVSLKAGETLLVSCDDENADAKVTWNGVSLHQDAGPGKGGGGVYTSIFSLYSATGGTGDIVASHVSRGDLAMNAFSVTNLAASALDKTSAADGNGASPSSGATPITTKGNEFLWAAIGYSNNDTASGAWSDGFTAGAPFTGTGGGIGGVDNAYKTVSSTGAYAAAKTGVTKDYWNALIATYAIAR